MGKAMKVGNKDGFGAVKRKDGWLRAKIGQVCIISTICIICIICFICIICIICGVGCGSKGLEKMQSAEGEVTGGGNGTGAGCAGEEGNRAESGWTGEEGGYAEAVGGGGTEEGKETDTSKQIAETYRDIYEKAAGEGKLSSLETIQDIVDRLGEEGYCAIDMENENQVNLTHPEKIEEFCSLVELGKKGEETIISIMEDGGFIRFDLETVHGEVFVTRSVLQWKGGMPEVDYMNRYPACEWEFSGNGYLFFRKKVPQGYDGDQGYTAIRVYPLEDECRELNRKYILPIGYNANQAFLLDWTEEELKGLDFDDLFSKLYNSTFGKPLPYEQTIDGTSYLVPEEEYEKVILSHFRMDKETLRAYGNYREKDRAYEYRSRGFNDCASSPNNPYPEVTVCERQEDGTWKLTVNAVWPIENMDKAFSHEVVVRVLEDGGFQYVSNRVIPDEDNAEPTWYTERAVK